MVVDVVAAFDDSIAEGDWFSWLNLGRSFGFLGYLGGYLEVISIAPTSSIYGFFIFKHLCLALESTVA